MSSKSIARCGARLLGLIVGMFGIVASSAAMDMSHADHGGAGAAVVAPRDLAVEQCWIRSMPASLPSAGYFIVVNKADQPATLQAIQSGSYGSAMLHETIEQGGMSRMVMTQSVTVPAKGKLAFAPGGHHAMLEKPAGKIEIGSHVAFDFVFAGGVHVPAKCVVRPASALGAQ